MDASQPTEQLTVQTAGWHDPDQADWYLERMSRSGARRAGELMMTEVLPDRPASVLDLGCGDGALTALVLESRPDVQRAVAVDLSPPMLERASARVGVDERVEVRRWDLRDPISPLGSFDLIVSGFAIHHLEDERKRELFVEVADALEPGGVFANLEVVASGSPQRHAEFLAAIGRAADDPEDRLAPVEHQLDWMRSARLVDVDCLWRWRGFALLVGVAP